MKNKTDINLIFESYIKNKALTEDNDQYAPEDAPEDDQFGEIEPEEDESVGEFDEFIEKAEKFVEAIGDDELAFLSTLRRDQFEVLMEVVSDQVGYRDKDQFGEIEPEEDAESGGVVYVVESDAEYEDTQVHGIFTDFETAKKYAAEVELLPGFWVGIMEMPLNKPEAKGKYHRLS
jgi:hypothetical protein